MILLHRTLKIVPFQRADPGLHESFELRPKAHRVRTDLPSAGLDRIWLDRCRVARVATFVPVPGRFKAGEHSHYFQHDAAAMAKILPRAEGMENIRINVCGAVGNEDILWSGPGPRDKLIEEAVRRNTSIKYALFRSFVCHECSPYLDIIRDFDSA